MNPIEQVQTSRLIAADTMASMFGRAGAFISVVVMISTFGSLMGSMLASPRIFFAMADDRLFFRPIAAVSQIQDAVHRDSLRVHSRHRHGDDADLRTAH